MSLRTCLAAAGLVLASTLVVTPLGTAGAVQAQQSQVVSAVPASYTPNLQNGSTRAIAKVGTKVVLGGDFTSVANAGSSTVLTRSRLLAFDATTGVVDPGFKPSFDKIVNAVVPGPSAGTVYVGGGFTTVNGTAHRGLVLLDVSTGAPVPGFTAPSFDGQVTDLRLSGGRLYVAGTFSKVGGVAHAGLATVNPTSGALDPFMSLQVAGHHNYMTKCDPTKEACAKGAVGVTAIDITPDGSRLAVIGNFLTVGGLSRDQIAQVSLTGTAATVAGWQTTGYAGKCWAKAYDSYVRDVDYSPDGSYFVVTATGGFPLTYYNLCDATARFQTGAVGSGVLPVWVDRTGSDTLYSVAITGTAVYVGGHQRWLNNDFVQDTNGPGAVPRPGLAALDPANGLPLAWNPGRNPRGAAAYVLVATSSGLYVGSDTDFIGNYKYKRMKIAYFPLSGGTPLPANNVGHLPGTVYQAGQLSGGDAVISRTFDGATPGPATTTSGSIAWHHARGGFMVNGTLWYGWDDGSFHKRTFNGSTFGPDQLVQPYHDPLWMNVQTGSGNTYDGNEPKYYADLPGISGVFFRDGRIYYTRTGQVGLWSRYFTPNSGIIGTKEFAVPTGGVSFSAAAGMFADGGYLYYGSSVDGALRRVSFSGGVVSGTPTVVSSAGTDGGDWRSRAMFLYVP